jgi:hypothetical protein
MMMMSDEVVGPVCSARSNRSFCDLLLLPVIVTPLRCTIDLEIRLSLFIRSRQLCG